MRKPSKDIQFTSYESLLGIESENIDITDKIIQVPIAELHTFDNHPFKVCDDEKMQETIDSIRENGVLVPGIVRKRKSGGYEIISGHRRKHACTVLGLKKMPVIVRDLTDDEAVIVMVDANIQRETLLPSEKAKAYKMKYEAMKHQGKNAGGLTLDEIGREAGESGKTVQRFIWLSRLDDELLTMVDEKKLGFSQGVSLSFLQEDSQQKVKNVVKNHRLKISTAQADQIKTEGRASALSEETILSILDKKVDGFSNIVIKKNKLHDYFSDSYSKEEMEAIIYQLLEEWKQKQ